MKADIIHLILFCSIVFAFSCKTENQSQLAIESGVEYSQFEFPPEWAPQEAVWIDFATDDSPMNPHPAKLMVIKTLSNYIKTKVVFDSDSMQNVASKWLWQNNADTTQIEYIKTSAPMNWIRDPGPIFLTDGKSLKVADFKWNCYGGVYGEACKEDMRGHINDELADFLSLKNEAKDLYLEGGGIEVSNNTAMAYKAMAYQRNPDKDIEEVEKIILDTYGKEQMIWLDSFPLIDKPLRKAGNFFGNGANGHIDVTTRFLNDSTILATVISEEDRHKNEMLKRDYKTLQSNLLQLQKAKRPNGQPYNIITIEAPDYSLYGYKAKVQEGFGDLILKHFKVGDSIEFVPALEYANFLITNGAVLVSEYWKEGMPESERSKDQKIQKILKEHFPDRDIISLDVLPINWGGGGIHCRTQQEPKVTGI